MLVNISGSFVIGFFATLTGPDGRLLVGTTARQLVMIGLCGGYTTFSSFSLQTFTLAQDGEWLRAGAMPVCRWSYFSSRCGCATSSPPC
jgi:CrcB protein